MNIAERAFYVIHIDFSPEKLLEIIIFVGTFYADRRETHTIGITPRYPADLLKSYKYFYVTKLQLNPIVVRIPYVLFILLCFAHSITVLMNVNRLFEPLKYQ